MGWGHQEKNKVQFYIILFIILKKVRILILI